MPRIAFYYLFFISITPLISQNIQLKKPFSAKDEYYLKRQVLDCFGFESHLKISYSTTELFNSKIKGDKPASLEEIENIRSRLKGNEGDAALYLDISGNYSRLKMNKEADENRNKAIEIAQKIIDKHPDSAEVYCFLGSAYMGATNINESIEFYRKAWTIKPTLVEAPTFMCNLFLMTGQLDSAYAIINKVVNLFPDNKSLYSILPMYYLFKMIGKLQKEDVNLDSDDFSVDSLTYFPLMENYLSRNKNDADAQYIHHVAKQVLISTIIPIRNSLDTAFSSTNVKFKLKEKEITFLALSKSYFETCLKNKNADYHFYANKLLGSIYILQNEPKKAIPYFKKTIDLRPKAYCSLSCNTDEDYDNLISAYAILRDTTMVEKNLIEKIAVQPAIEPKVDDHNDLGSLYLSKNKFNLAKAEFAKSLAIEPENAYALLGVGVLNFVENDNTSALKYIDKVYKIDNKKWELFMLYGAILLKQNDIYNSYEAFKIMQKIHDRTWIENDILSYFFQVNN